MSTTEPTVQELFDLTGRVALITGAGGYLGTSLSRALAEAGATVVASSRDHDKAREIAAALPRPKGQTHHGVALDHMDAASAEGGFVDALGEAGRLDVLVNNGHEGLGKDLTTVTPEEFSRQLANATGYFQLARLLRNHVAQRRAAGEASATGSVIMLGSMYGVVGSYPEAYEGISVASPVAYHCLKGGVVHMTRHLAVYWGKDGVRVNCLSPGPFPNEP